MTTERQKSANRKNAARSTGPRTVAGKAEVRGNARTFDIFSVDAFLLEDRAAFEALRQKMYMDLEIKGEDEQFYGDLIVKSMLRMQNIMRREASIRRYRMERLADEAHEAHAEQLARILANLRRGSSDESQLPGTSQPDEGYCNQQRRELLRTVLGVLHCQDTLQRVRVEVEEKSTVLGCEEFDLEILFPGLYDQLLAIVSREDGDVVANIAWDAGEDAHLSDAQKAEALSLLAQVNETLVPLLEEAEEREAREMALQETLARYPADAELDRELLYEKRVLASHTRHHEALRQLKDQKQRRSPRKPNNAEDQ
jgi:hypothetical protein